MYAGVTHGVPEGSVLRTFTSVMLENTIYLNFGDSQLQLLLKPGELQAPVKEIKTWTMLNSDKSKVIVWSQTSRPPPFFLIH